MAGAAGVQGARVRLPTGDRRVVASAMLFSRLLPSVIVLALALGMPMLSKKAAVADAGCAAGCADISVMDGCPACPDGADRPTHNAAHACAAVCAGMAAVTAIQAIPAWQSDQPFHSTACRILAGRAVAPERSPPRTAALA
jgi:hypothetical protein